MSRGGYSHEEWARRRKLRMAEEVEALKHRCPLCDAGPGRHCIMGTPYGLHFERRLLGANALRTEIRGGKA